MCSHLLGVFGLPVEFFWTFFLRTLCIQQSPLCLSCQKENRRIGLQWEIYYRYSGYTLTRQSRTLSC